MGPYARWRSDGGDDDLPCVTGILELSDLFGRPLAQRLRLARLGAAALGEQLADGLHVEHAQHVGTVGGAQIAKQRGRINAIVSAKTAERARIWRF